MSGRKRKDCLICGSKSNDTVSCICPECYITYPHLREIDRPDKFVRFRLNNNHDLYFRYCTFCGVRIESLGKTKYPTCLNKECISKKEKLLREEKPKKYKEITCGVCGKKITVLAKSTGGKSSNKKYCSDKCRQIQEANRRKVYKEKIGIEKFREMNRAVNDRRRSDPVKKLICNIRTYLSMTLSKNQSAKGSNTFKILGYDADTLRRHLEKQFKDGMTWDNYGNVWHVDHRIPTDAFNFKQVDKRKLHEVIRKCWALDNLQPLDAIENMRKSNKILY